MKRQPRRIGLRDRGGTCRCHSRFHEAPDAVSPESRMKSSRFFAMVGTSTVIMYGLMYLNTYALDHVYFSQTRLWMAVVMGATMAIVMLAFMLGMYKSPALNLGIFTGSVV